MKHLLILIFVLCSNILVAQGTLVIDTKMTVTNFQLKHMEESQYTQMSEENIDSNYVVIYYEEYQAYNVVINNDYHLVFKINAGEDYSTPISIDNIQIVCSCNYTFLDIGESKILSITF